jgi:hypothetical protein
MEDDAIPTLPVNPWRNRVELILSDVLNSKTTEQQWKAIVLSPLISPGFLQIRQSSFVQNIAHIERGYNLSTALVLYNRRIIPFFEKWKQYYTAPRVKYTFGIDRLLSSHLSSKNEHFITNIPLAEQDPECGQDNPGAFLLSACVAAQTRSKIILHTIAKSKTKRQSSYVLNGIYFSIIRNPFSLLSDLNFFLLFYIIFIVVVGLKKLVVDKPNI